MRGFCEQLHAAAVFVYHEQLRHGWHALVCNDVKLGFLRMRVFCSQLQAAFTLVHHEQARHGLHSCVP